MKKTVFTFILSLLVFLTLTAQKEFWGLRSGQNLSTNYGSIFKTDFNGENPEAVYAFNSNEGMYPYGRLFLASNGKLYGTAYKGGTVLSPTSTGGVLFEYDLTVNQFKIVTSFGSNQAPDRRNPQSGVIEPIEGILFGTTETGGIYKHTIATEITNNAGNVPNIGSILNPMSGELFKASNGLVYGTTKYYSSCLVAEPLLGSIVRVNPSTSAFNVVFPFNCTITDGKVPTGSLIEGTTGKLYGTTVVGGPNFGPNGTAPSGSGVLFEYNFTSNTYTKKFDFNYLTTGSFPGPLTMGNNNKLYGLLESFGTNPSDPTEEGGGAGSIFEYDIQTNAVTILHYFPSSISFFNSPRGSLLKASDGNFYGFNNAGIFKFNSTTNVVTQTTIFFDTIFNSDAPNDLIEICRKPSYHFFDIDAFDTCVGENFTYDIQNTNAITYQWQQNGNNIDGQTSGILNLTNLNISDAGDYTCVMTNECGSTTTMALHLTVNCLGNNTIANFEESIKLYPNPTHSVLNIQLPTNIDITITSLKVIDILGKETLMFNNGSTNMDVSHLSKGIYILTLHTNYGIWNGKFVKI